MTRIVYVNGEYVREEEAKISIFDRGFLFADGVYEVTSVIGGKLIDFEGHPIMGDEYMNELRYACLNGLIYGMPQFPRNQHICKI